MCDWRYGFLRCDAGFLHGKDAPAWAKWCPRCNGPTLIKEARDVSLVAFQQAMALCASESVGEVRAWLRFAVWPVTIPTGVDGETIVLTQSEADALWDDALAAAPRTDDVEASIIVAAVINELEAVKREIGARRAMFSDASYARMIISLGSCRGKLADLTKPKELT